MTSFCPVFSIVYSRNPAGYNQGAAAQRFTKEKVTWLLLRPGMVPSWCGATGTVSGCWTQQGISGPPSV